MSHRRLAAAVVFSAIIVAVLALIIYTERSNATQTVSVLIVTHDVSAGTPYDVADVQVVQVRAQAGDFNYETRGPAAFPARFARNLATNDILRADDLIANTAESVVALTVETPPPLTAGESIDIFAALAGDQQVLVGHDLIVNTVSGGSLTVLVPVADEASWIAVGSSNVALHIALTVAGAQIAPSPLGANAAIRILCGAACAGLPDEPAPTP
ncbi:MAG TPA: hypothetical protein VMU65_14995 [Candidatus Saccharimonadales bacterium]|nr:hypothetical protein [Candidatus Saccharimonadales bacterium]